MSALAFHCCHPMGCRFAKARHGKVRRGWARQGRARQGEGGGSPPANHFKESA